MKMPDFSALTQHFDYILATVATVIGILVGVKNLFKKEKSTPNTKPTEIQAQQSTTRDQSPSITAKGDVTVNYGVSKKVVDRILNVLDENDIAIEKREAKLLELAQKYKEVEERLARRSAEDTLAAKARKRLEDGDLDDAERLLKLSLNLKVVDEKRREAAADAFELGNLKEVQLEYRAAEGFYKQVVQLGPENSLYLTNFGFLFHALSNPQERIDYCNKALKIDIAAFGENHPNVATTYNNIGQALRPIAKTKEAIGYLNKALKIKVISLKRN